MSQLEDHLASAHWESPWVMAPDNTGLVDELHRELGPGHELEGLPVKAIARRDDCDDVLFAIGDPPERLAVVHLTWAGQRETDPTMPWTLTYDTFEAFWAARDERL